MSRAVKQPVGQKRLTNIAVVRLKKAGKRFEIACYRNKVNDWRSGIEKDLDEVLQTTNIFANVGKGINAKKEDLQEAFGTTDEEKICLEILSKGELQVSDKERRAELDVLFKDVVSVLVDKTINPQSRRPYTHTMLERALRDLHFNPDTRKSAKQQALEVLPQLQAQFPIERARMRLRLDVPSAVQQQLLDMLQQRQSTIETCEELGAGTSTVVTQVEPGVFRDLHHFMQDVASQQGRIEVLSFAVTVDATDFDDFAAMPGPSTDAAAAAAAAAAQRGGDAADGGPSSSSAEDGSRPPPSQQGRRGQAAAGCATTTGAAAAGDSGRVAAAAANGVVGGGGGGGGDVLYPRGPVAALPEDYASRKERFLELDQLQPGWSVELRRKGEVVDAQFYAPDGRCVGAFANARRQALQAHRQPPSAAAAAQQAQQ